jgi:hypothetical protein
MPVDGGGSETIGITLPLDATNDMMEAAIRQWQMMREKALPALRQAITAAKIQEEAQADLPIEEIKITFGKFKGATLGYIYKTDQSYLDWLANKADPERTEKIWRDRAKQILANPPEAAFAATDDNDLPF